jgi:hypothetical protein
MPPVGLETAIPANGQPQTHALHRAATSFGPPGLLQRENLYIDDTFTVRRRNILVLYSLTDMRSVKNQNTAASEILNLTLKSTFLMNSKNKKVLQQTIKSKPSGPAV